MRVGDSTPWGIADHVERVAEGIYSVSTPSHGGYWLSNARINAMPDEYGTIPTFAGGRWYEEDCDAALVIASFPEVFGEEMVESAKAALEMFARNGFERFEHLTRKA